MQIAAFRACCPFEIGDTVKDRTGQHKTITDIIVIHRVKTGSTEFVFELDNSGKLVKIKFERQVILQ